MPTHGLVLTAAGASKRFGGGVSKVLLLLDGVPVISRAARAFREALGTTPTVITARVEDLDAIKALCRREDSLLGAVVVSGGPTRQASVALGVRALPPGIDVVLVHDAARPLVSIDLIRRVAEAADRDGAATPAIVVLDSVHRVGSDGRLVESIDRESLRTVQTPQAARIALIRHAIEHAEKHALVTTDEVALLIAAGVPVTPVHGDPRNIKITVPADVTRAAELLAQSTRSS
jgi:2-C-methyl-D-erythritol 4-phosphate cytidylyltransferase